MTKGVEGGLTPEGKGGTGRVSRGGRREHKGEPGLAFVWQGRDPLPISFPSRRAARRSA